MTAAGLIIILLALVSFDPRVRDQVEFRLSSPTAVVTDAGHGLQNMTDVLLDALREQSLDRAPLLIFVFGAGVLLLFMLRS